MTTLQNNSPKKRFFRPVDGILLLDKPSGMSSNQAVQCVKRLFCAEKAGHTGTLDPLASGLLPICLGNATKFSQFSLDADKVYEVTAILGSVTATGDMEGEVLETHAVKDFSFSYLASVIQTFVGIQLQTPPLYSAIKWQGKPLYQLARAGKTADIVPKKRSIHVQAIEIQHYEKPHLCLRVHCSKGTYIRSLIPDIGKALHCGATVKTLRRVGISGYENQPMHDITLLKTLSAERDFSAMDQFLLPMEHPLSHHSAIHLTDTQVLRITQGQKIEVGERIKEEMELFRLYYGRQFIGIAEYHQGHLQPKRLCSIRD